MEDKTTIAARNRWKKLVTRRDYNTTYNRATGFSFDVKGYIDFGAAADEAWHHYEYFQHRASLAVIQQLPADLADLVKTDIDAAYSTAKAAREAEKARFIHNGQAEAHFQAIHHYRCRLLSQSH